MFKLAYVTVGSLRGPDSPLYSDKMASILNYTRNAHTYYRDQSL